MTIERGVRTRKIESLDKDKMATWEVYGRYITQDKVLVAMGPGAGIAYDASLLIAASLLGRSGQLYVVDPRSESQGVKLDEQEKGPVRGVGDIDLHILQLKYLYEGGMNVALPKWAGPSATCASTMLPDMSCDVIIDHNTSPFVTLSDDKSERMHWLERTYCEYARIMRPGGTLLLQTSNQLYNFGSWLGRIPLTRILKNSGFAVQTQEVVDTHYLPLSNEEAELLRNVPIEVEIFDSIARNLKVNNRGESYFERSARQSQFVRSHESINMYVGVRI